MRWRDAKRDNSQFDALTRTLVTSGSRRTLLGLVAALGFGVADAEAKKKKKKKPCPPCKKRKKGKCKATLPDGSACSGGTCQGGTCLAVSPPPSPPPRGPLTLTFANQTPITMPGSGAAAPYPSTIEVTGFLNGAMTGVNVHINGYSEPVPEDIDVLLAASQLPGLNAIILSDVGGASAINNVNLVLDDAAASPLPDGGPIVSGTFQPTNASGAADMFPAPAPTPSGNSLLSVFNNQNPNGTWQLFINDNAGNGDGSIASWALEITAKVDL